MSGTVKAGLPVLAAAVPVAVRRRERKRPAKPDGAYYKAKYAELSADLDDLLYSISHDLRAPLRALDGFSEALAEEYGEVLAEPGREYVAELQAASRHMRALLEGVLRLSRLGRRPMRLEDVDLGDLARSVAADASRADPGNQPLYSIAPSIVARGDRDLLRELLTILFENARKFTRTRSPGRIEFGLDPGRTRSFFVRDNGIGFESLRQESQALLFAPFQVLHPAEDGSGVGVGLALAHRIVRRHGGKIWAEAEADKGATFHFTLSGEGR